MEQLKYDNISIIIPVLNEGDCIGKLLANLKNSSGPSIKEIIIVDGGSQDNTVKIASNMGVKILHSKKGRAKQMNLGAQHASGDILYFLHADTLPPLNFALNIQRAVTQGNKAGCFRMRFDSKSRFLKFFAWFSRVNYKICRGGDQTLFITKQLFKNTKGFNEDYIVYEDNEFIGRLYEETNFIILPQYVHTSARKYEKVGKTRLQFHFGVIHLKNYLGASPEQLYDYYKRKIAI